MKEVADDDDTVSTRAVNIRLPQRCHTREGRLVLLADKPAGSSLFGAMKGSIDSRSLTEDESGAEPQAWKPSL